VGRRQAVAAGLRIELDQLAGRHRAEPFANVALGETGLFGQLLARHRAMLHRFEQTGAVPDRNHHGERRLIGHPDQALGEFLFNGSEARLGLLELVQKSAIGAHLYMFPSELNDEELAQEHQLHRQQHAGHGGISVHVLAPSLIGSDERRPRGAPLALPFESALKLRPRTARKPLEDRAL
jgi:hypothetical protein